MIIQQRRKRALPLLVIVALAVVVVLGVLNWVKLSRAGHSVSALHRATDRTDIQAPMETSSWRTALFVGDDFLAWGRGYYTYPYVVCDTFKLNCNVDAQTGTGFLSNGQNYSSANRPLIDRLPTDKEVYNAPDIVIVDAGRNDIPAEPEVFGGAVESYLREVKQSWPQAEIVVIAPWVMAPEQDPTYAATASIICERTEVVGAMCIDPVAEGWFTGVDVSTSSMDDNRHPNQSGHTFVGRKLAEFLQSHGRMAGEAPPQ
ncbi:SGNH/GDSL hydrolase family protein [Mycobacterium sp. SMC-13]|uniref:SGNH/GDSL hydrolase family protein n=1 Tax=Mycobacterium sp. SMC-13 TaxID=3381626 RepID=UPI00387709E6